MQTAMIRLYDDTSYRHLRIEAPIPRVAAMKEILAGFRAAAEQQLNWEATRESLSLEWAGYQRYQAAAPLGEQHLTHVRLHPPVGAHRVEYVFPDGLFPVECDDLCWQLVGDDDDRDDQKREWLVTSTLAGVLHSVGISLAEHVIAVACGQTALIHDLIIIPTTPPTHAMCRRARPWLVGHRRMAA